MSKNFSDDQFDVEFGLEFATEVTKKAMGEIEKDRSFAWELIGNARRDSKRWFISLIVVLALWFATIGTFVWYLNQYDFTSTTTTIEGTQDGSGVNIISGGDATNGAGSEDSQGDQETN